MSEEIEFLYDFGSPNAYLVHKVLPVLANHHDARVVYQPILLGGVFKATNNQSPFQAFAGVSHKLSYLTQEVQRFVQRHDVAFAMNPHFPVNTLGLMRAAVFSQDKPWYAEFVDAVFDSMWVAGDDLSDPDTIRSVLLNAGLPAGDIFSAIQTPHVKSALMSATSDAVERGVFGAPTMFFKGEMFFGKDSLPDLEWRLASLA